MLNVDVSNIWCSVTLPNLLSLEQSVSAAHAALQNGGDFLPWLDEDWKSELRTLHQYAQWICDQSEFLIVVGNNSAAQGAQALLELLRGRFHTLRPGPKVLFAGRDLSTFAWQRLWSILEGKDFCVHVIDRDGMALQSAVTLRSLRWALERRYGTDKARERLLLTTDAAKGALHQLSIQEGCTTFVLPWTLNGHASVLTPSAMLCLLTAGIDVASILEGAVLARRRMEIRSFDNPAWLYAAARTALADRGRRVEYLSCAEPDAWELCRWWQQLFGERTGQGKGGLIPVSAELPADLQALHGILGDGQKPLLQTVLRFSPPHQKQQVEMDWTDYDGLNCLNGFTIDFLQEQLISSALQSGVDGSVPLVTMDGGSLCEQSLGELLYFFELTSCLCAGMMGRNLYASEPPAVYAEAMNGLLRASHPGP